VRCRSRSQPTSRWRSEIAPALGVIVVSLVMGGCVTRSATMVGSVGFREVQLSGSNRPWAPYARVALVPFAVVADIVTSPFQAIYFLMIGLGH
jgi:hypothetical protein